MKAFEDKKLLITGGTGSFGNAVLEVFSESSFKEIRILSRDEKKQDDMRKKYRDPRIKFFLGDVRDKESINNAINGVDYIFHAAALKQVPSCEFYPMEAVKTNILGTYNVVSSAKEHEVRRLICLSTDKAVYPINSMGISKAMMEKIVISESRNLDSDYHYCVTRYGNVMGSRGSVIPLFLKQIENKIPLTLTHRKMTRFMMTLMDAVNLVMYAFNNGENGSIYIQKSPAATLETLADSILKLKNLKDYPITEIGIRHGEKMHEVLASSEEMFKADDHKEYLKIPPDDRDLNYESFFETGDNTLPTVNPYTSENTKRLDIAMVQNLLKRSWS